MSEDPRARAERYMVEKLREPGFTAVEPNKLGLATAKILHAGKDALNWPGKLSKEVPLQRLGPLQVATSKALKALGANTSGVPIPLIGGMGAGDLVMGHAPEAIEDYSYGIKGPWTHAENRADPRTLDIAMLPFLASGVKGGLSSIVENMSKPVAPVAVDLSRREFMKKANALGVAAVAGAGALGGGSILKAALKELAPATLAQSGKAAIAGLTAGLLKHTGEWFKPGKGYEALMDRAQYGSGMSWSDKGVWPESLKELASHPDLEKALAKAIGDTPHAQVSNDMLSQVASWSSHNEFHGLPHSEASWAARDKAAKLVQTDPKVLKDFEELLVTGKLPKGAHEGLPELGWTDVPKHSKLRDLLDVSFDVSGKVAGKMEAHAGDLVKRAIAGDKQALAEMKEVYSKGHASDMIQEAHSQAGYKLDEIAHKGFAESPEAIDMRARNGSWLDAEHAYGKRRLADPNLSIDERRAIEALQTMR